MGAGPVSMSEAAKKTFGWPADLNHAPGPPETTPGNQFKAACRCGYVGRAGSTPSQAYQHTKRHADTENARDRGEVAPAAHAPSESPAGSSVTSRTSAGSPCGCGCGESSGGLFRPGHDSKLISRLVKSVKAGSVTVEQAVAEMAEIGTSDKLQAKFRQKAGG